MRFMAQLKTGWWCGGEAGAEENGCLRKGDRTVGRQSDVLGGADKVALAVMLHLRYLTR